MLERIPFEILLGTYPLLIGTCMAIWPTAVTGMTMDDDNKPLPLTPANIRWTRIVGIGAVVLGILIIMSVILGVKGAEDPVLF